MPSFSQSYRDELEERIDERGELIEERLEDIPRGRTTPQLDSQSLHSARKYRLGMCFVDINNFTDYSRRNEDRDALFMLNTFISETMELVRDYEGRLEKNTGDGILAYFGAGDADDEAVETLLEYVATLKWVLANHVNPMLRRKDIETVTMSVGATYSNVNISRIGARSGKQQMNRLTAVSSGANVASRLESMAGVNEYFMNDGIYNYSDKENGWGQYLQHKGRHEGFRWGSESSGYDPANYYNFSGIWKSTVGSNLR